MDSGICCFSGHRIVPAQVREELELLLEKHITGQFEHGVRCFLCGGAMGFDAIAARAVLKARERMDDISLSLAIPYRGMEQRWPLPEKQEFENILAAADSVHYLAESYDRDCMLRRNRYMIEKSETCICYMTRNTGGTAYTVAQAVKKGCTVINLALELE